MGIFRIESLDDARLAPYRKLKDRELARHGGMFIAEGENVVRRLLASKYRTESVFVSDRKVEATAPLVPAEIPLLVGDDETLKQVLGFKFHSGVIACGSRNFSTSLESITQARSGRQILAVCQEINNSENMGALIRISAAFGAVGMLVGERCGDPFFRRSIRVSMGTIFSLPIVRSSNLLSDLEYLKSERGFDTVASVLSPDATALRELPIGPRMAVVFGSEAHGLDQATAGRCSYRVTIPMQLGTDSLNVAVAAALFLYQLTI